jgi:coenzyme F420-0:L-glutamate ligase/coenzyme F420-1:gamma-L-glutamate ligase
VAPKAISIWPLAGLPEIKPGDDLTALLVEAIASAGLHPQAGDIVVVTSKIVAKAQNRFVALAGIEPGARARALAALTGKDARLVQVILHEAREVLRATPHVIIVETRDGLILANAGIDQSNLSSGDQGVRVLLLPEAPDAAAEALKRTLDARFGTDLGVIISDSAGRPWRLGTVGIGIGAAGVTSLWDRRGETDFTGRKLEVTEVAFADSVASAAVLAMGEGAEGCPAALVRGYATTAPARPAAHVLRPKPMDLFR